MNQRSNSNHTSTAKQNNGTHQNNGTERRVNRKLQRKRALSHGLGMLGIQRAVKVGASNDKFEQQANENATRVMNMAEPKTAARATLPGSEGIQRKDLQHGAEKEIDHENKMELTRKPLQRKIERDASDTQGNQVRRMGDEDTLNTKPIEISRMTDEETNKAMTMPLQRMEEEGDGETTGVSMKPLAQRNELEGYGNEDDKTTMQAKCKTCDADDKGTMPPMAQRKAKGEGFTAGKQVSDNVAAIKSSFGQPLAAADREFLEPRFGRDLSHVRIHNDDRAAKTSQAIEAKAFTVGNDIAFNKGYYKPGTSEGRSLLAHEITHTFQQTGGKKKGAGGKSGAKVGGVNRDVLQRENEKSRKYDYVFLRNKRVISDGTIAYLEGKHYVYKHANGRYSEIKISNIKRISYGLTRSEGKKEAVKFLSKDRSGESIVGSGAIATHDALMRLKYNDAAQELAKKMMEDYKAGKIDHMMARTKASAGRNQLLNETRAKVSPGARALSKAMKEEGKTLQELANRYALKRLWMEPELRKKYGIRSLDPNSKTFNQAKMSAALNKLSPSEMGNAKAALKIIKQSRSVSEEIVRASARTNSAFTGVARASKVLGPAGIVLGAGVSTYDVYTAPEGEKLYVAGREMSGFVGGTVAGAAGGVAGAYVASLLCGPAYVVCAIVVTLAISAGAGYAGSEGSKFGYEEFMKKIAETDIQTILRKAIGGDPFTTEWFFKGLTGLP